jgi:integrase/recombinase XerD
MPSNADLERRNRALIAFMLLTGARDSAIASMKLKHVDVVVGSVFQDAREVRTKFSKTFITYFFPVGAEIRQIVADWVRFLREEKLWSPDEGDTESNEDPGANQGHVAESKRRADG